MKTVTSFLILLFSFTSGACEISKPIVSLSGPITMLLDELNLLNDKNVLGISKFHPVKPGYKGKIYSGGIFLSNKTLKSFRNSKIYFDKSRGFKQILKKAKISNYQEFDSRDQNPFEVLNMTIIKTQDILKNCFTEIEKLEKKSDKIQKELKLNSELSKSIFFLGSLGHKLPKLVIANDGFVLSLREFDNFKTYPSDISYVPWSQKVLKGLKSYMHIGIDEGSSEVTTINKLSTLKYNISMRGALTPGMRQIYLLQSLQGLKFKR